MLSTAYSAGLIGVDGFPVTVEVNYSNRLENFFLVGLPDAAVKEAKDRIRSAIENSGFSFPDGELTINLAPADRKKQGSAYDLAILVGILSSSGQISPDLGNKCFIGELSLSGGIRGVTGVLCMVLAAKEAGKDEIFVPFDNVAEASVVDGVRVYGVKTVKELTDHLTGNAPIEPRVFDPSMFDTEFLPEGLDFADVKGQETAKRAAEIAAAGGHNLLFIGPPGTGKSMISKRIPSILPPLTFREAIETTKIHSIAGSLPPGISLIRERPFRSPHHTLSSVALAGGGTYPMPGEISLAHNGVLFLDELPEFSKTASEVLRQPLEDREITITRASGRVTFPCSFMLVCAMNPCRCGNYGNPNKACTCKPREIKEYLSRISGPLLDRIDIEVEVPPVSFDEMANAAPAESSSVIRERVIRAREIMAKRFEADGGKIFCNAQMNSRQIRTYCRMTDEASTLLRQAFDSMGLSPRGHDRILRVARTIADLAGEETIGMAHIAEAVRLRSLDRKYW
ncbi:MAG: YifB family Mg chelatase-like AAA ATPase [Lachnospiraceae bacterium]|nr:YifB family Mg chelatase-like AAA ATPase [Lachnospiraceae bacterium]